MRIIRFQYIDEEPQFGWVNDDEEHKLLGSIEGNPFGNFHRLEAKVPLENVHLLPPVQPTKIICIGRNYIAHAQEHGAEVPNVPLLFLKPPSAVIGPEEKILLPPQSEQVEHEAELALVIRKKGRWIAPYESMDYLLGFTIGNDITARDLQRKDGQWTRAKGFDTFCPIGPWIETEFDPSDALITCHVNGEMRQMASTRDMHFSVRQLIAYASSVMTLEIGDVLFTGTPAGVGQLQPGDMLETAIEGIGTLRNSIEQDTTI